MAKVLTCCAAPGHEPSSTPREAPSNVLCSNFVAAQLVLDADDLPLALAPSPSSEGAVLPGAVHCVAALKSGGRDKPARSGVRDYPRRPPREEDSTNLDHCLHACVFPCTLSSLPSAGLKRNIPSPALEGSGDPATSTSLSGERNRPVLGAASSSAVLTSRSRTHDSTERSSQVSCSLLFF